MTTTSLAPERNGSPVSTEAAAGADPTNERSTQQSRLVELASARFRFGRDPEGNLFAVPLSGPQTVSMLRGAGNSFRATLADAFVSEYGTAPSSNAIASALLALEGRARRAEPEPLAVRVAEMNGAVVIDLGDETGRAVIVGAEGWEVVSTPPVLFRRSNLTMPLPTPKTGGTLAELRRLVHVTDDAWPLAVGWLLLCLLPSKPAPILFFRGAHGAGKSSAARFFSRLVDPSSAQLRSAPSRENDWPLTVSNTRVVPLDNLSRLPEWLADALCRAVTGDGIVRRALYTDGDVVVHSFKRAICLSGIAIEGVRADVADRLLPIELDRIDRDARREEDELERDFARAWPEMFGALLDLLAEVLRALPDVRPSRLPRLADAARVFAALDKINEGATDAFESFCALAGRLADEVVDDDTVADAIRVLVMERGSWGGTTAELLTAITPDQKPRGWPETPQALASRITRAEEPLRLIGIHLRRGQTGKGPSRRRHIEFTVSTAGETDSLATGDTFDDELERLATKHADLAGEGLT